MTNWLCSRESVKRSLEVKGTDKNAAIDAAIDGASRKILSTLKREFFPRTGTDYFPPGDSGVLYLKQDLLAVTALTSENGGITFAAGDYLLEPVNEGPPYNRLVINAATSNAVSFAAGASGPRERANAVTGRWGYSESTRTAGTVASGLASDATATTFVCSDASLIEVGDTLLIESEQLFVSERSTFDSTANLASDIAAQSSVVTVPINTGSLIKQSEVIQIDSEKMYVQSVSGNNLTVIRAYDGTTLAAHTSSADVYVFRTLTVVRGVNGTTAATHANSTAASKYVPPPDITDLCRAEAIFNYEQNESGQTGVVGAGEAGTNVRPRSLMEMWAAAKANYGQPLSRVL